MQRDELQPSIFSNSNQDRNRIENHMDNEVSSKTKTIILGSFDPNENKDILDFSPKTVSAFLDIFLSVRKSMNN